MRRFTVDGTAVYLISRFKSKLIELKCDQSGLTQRNVYSLPNSQHLPSVSSIEQGSCLLVISRPSALSAKLFVADRDCAGSYNFQPLEWPFESHYARSVVGLSNKFLIATVEHKKHYDMLPHSLVEFNPQSKQFTIVFQEEVKHLRKSSESGFMMPELTSASNDVFLSDGLLKNFSCISAGFRTWLRNPDHRVDTFGVGIGQNIATLKMHPDNWILSLLSCQAVSRQTATWKFVPWKFATAITVTPTNHILIFDGDRTLFWQSLGAGDGWNAEILTA